MVSESTLHALIAVRLFSCGTGEEFKQCKQSLVLYAGSALGGAVVGFEAENKMRLVRTKCKVSKGTRVPESRGGRWPLTSLGGGGGGSSGRARCTLVPFTPAKLQLTLEAADPPCIFLLLKCH